jgi:ribosome-binding factor A
MTQRTDRIDELLRQEISQLLAREVADPGLGFVTITQIETSQDLRHARVWVSVIGQPEARRASIEALERAMPFIRRELGKRLRIRRIPEFTVKLDESSERGTRVMQLLSELEAGGIPDELPDGESLPTPTPRLAQPGEAPPEAFVVPTKPDRKRRQSSGGGRGSGAAGGSHGAQGARKPSRPHAPRPGRGPAQ